MSIRNLSYLPIMGTEGVFYGSLPEPPKLENQIMWYDGLKPYERLYYHQTLNTVRKNQRFHQVPGIPKDSLDYILQSRYNHSQETFPDKIDFFLQADTVGEESFRVLRNRKQLRAKQVEHMGHPLIIGGTTEKMSPYSVKLINSGHHTQSTNKGYSRQPADGNIFHY